MATIVKIEGKNVPVDDEIGKTNKGVIDALLPYFPAVANADLKREEKDGTTTITVTKKAGSKGIYAPVVNALDAATEEISPMLLFQSVDPKSISGAKLQAAVTQMLDHERAIGRVVYLLDEAEPQSAMALPRGF